MTSLSRLTFTMGRVMAAKGFFGLLDTAWRRLLRRPVVSEPRLVKYSFDTRYGVHTSGLVNGSAESDQYAYYGINPSVFRGACRRWMDTLDYPAQVERYSFVDLGSGLGRALLLASELPFREVIGVEVSPELVAGARNNIETWIAGGHARAPIRLQQQDARDFDFPRAPLLVFLYNPFGECTLLEVLARLSSLCQLSSGTIDILYCYPKHGYAFDKKSQFKKLWMAPIPLDEEDRSADAFGSKVEVCALYRCSSRQKK
jgi:SAM-dependent methyltransferase